MTLTRNDYKEGIERIEEVVLDNTSYLDKFKFDFPQGLNTANALEICRAIESSDLESKVRIMRLCILKKNVEVTCPNGEVEKFCMSELSDSFDAFPLFQKEPLALTGLADCIYGYLLKKYLRLSKPKEAVAQTESKI